MIITEVFYGLKCNRCEELYDDGEHSFWTDEGSTIENAMESEWAEVKGKHYCPSCHSGNEESDDIIVFEDFPQHLKTLNKFIDRIVFGTRRNVFETETEFMVKCSFYKTPKLSGFEEKYIRELLADKFISFEYEEGKYNSFVCIIKFSK